MRRYDIDWLRAIALGLLIVYHTAIIFQPWAFWIQFPQSEEPWEGLWLAMAMLNTWRIPLLFFIAGMGAWFSIRRRGWGKMLGERSLRILLPLIFCGLTLVPLFAAIYLQSVDRPIVYQPGPGHLWFLANIFIYTLLASPLMFYFKRHPDSLFLRGCRRIATHPLGLFLFYLPFLLEVLWMNPPAFEFFMLTPHGFWFGLLAFTFGATFMAMGETFSTSVIRLRYATGGLALAGYLVRLIHYELDAPNMLTMFESLNWIFAIFGFAARYLNQPSRALRYLSEATYPVYVFHMLAMLGAALIVLPIGLPNPLKFLVITAATFLGSFGLFELTRRIPYLRILFGMHLKGPSTPPIRANTPAPPEP